MKKFLILFLFIGLPAVASNLYDDILTPEDKAKIRYADCSDADCINRVHLENMRELDLIQSMMQLNQTPIYENNTNNEIKYGYDPFGNYVPQSVGGHKLKYGYNAQGDYVIKSYE